MCGPKRYLERPRRRVGLAAAWGLEQPQTKPAGCCGICRESARCVGLVGLPPANRMQGVYCGGMS